MVQALIDLGGEKVVYTHPNRGRQYGMIMCVNDETLGLWIVDDALNFSSLVIANHDLLFAVKTKVKPKVKRLIEEKSLKSRCLLGVKKGKKGRKTRNGHVFEGEKISVESFNRWGEQKKRLGAGWIGKRGKILKLVQ